MYYLYIDFNYSSNLFAYSYNFILLPYYFFAHNNFHFLHDILEIFLVGNLYVCLPSILYVFMHKRSHI